jgi:hypothetical protein
MADVLYMNCADMAQRGGGERAAPRHQLRVIININNLS